MVIHAFLARYVYHWLCFKIATFWKQIELNLKASFEKHKESLLDTLIYAVKKILIGIRRVISYMSKYMHHRIYIISTIFCYCCIDK